MKKMKYLSTTINCQFFLQITKNYKKEVRKTSTKKLHIYMKVERSVNENVYISIFTVNHEVFIRNLNHGLGQNFQKC